MKKAKSKTKDKSKKTKAAVRSEAGKAELEKTTEGKAAIETMRPVDFVQVRKNIAALVGGAAQAIAEKAIKDAKDGEMAPVKYFFEAVGLYPAPPETESRPEDSLAYTLLKRMGLPTDPVIGDEDEELPLGTREVMGARGNGADTERGDESPLRQNENQRDAVK
jgi:hypothetical protein